MWRLEDAGKNRWTMADFRCLARSGWNDADCELIVLRDESHFQLCPNDYQRRAWRCPGQRANPAFPIACHTDPQPGVMVWGTISLDSRTPLVVIKGHTCSTAYPGLTFQQDNVRPHMACVAMNCLTACQTLPWPARSPDLSPIEHVWDMMGRRLAGNVDDLARQLESIWQEIPQETIREHYHFMSRRVATCIQARRRSTPY